MSITEMIGRALAEAIKSQAFFTRVLTVYGESDRELTIYCRREFHSSEFEEAFTYVMVYWQFLDMFWDMGPLTKE